MAKFLIVEFGANFKQNGRVVGVVGSVQEETIYIIVSCEDEVVAQLGDREGVGCELVDHEILDGCGIECGERVVIRRASGESSPGRLN